MHYEHLAIFPAGKDRPPSCTVHEHNYASMVICCGQTAPFSDVQAQNRFSGICDWSVLFDGRFLTAASQREGAIHLFQTLGPPEL